MIVESIADALDLNTSPLNEADRSYLELRRQTKLYSRNLFDSLSQASHEVRKKLVQGRDRSCRLPSIAGGEGASRD